MGFYEQISKYYDYIFPVGEQQLKFIKESLEMQSKRILDVACGSGGYAVELAKAGHIVTAVDLDHEMVRMTAEKADLNGLDVEVFRCDMKELELILHPGFKCIFCIGNSIVHLGSLGEITKVLLQMYNLLDSNGTLILQIINFDRVLKFGITDLPTLKNDEIDLEFIRKYEYIKEKGIINFNTILKIGKGNERYENSIELFPVLSGDIIKGLRDIGFKEIDFYGDFNYSEYNENSFMLVAKAKK